MLYYSPPNQAVCDDPQKTPRRFLFVLVLQAETAEDAAQIQAAGQITE